MDRFGWGTSKFRRVVNIPSNPHEGWKNCAIPDGLFYFEYEHLPRHLQDVSKKFWTLVMDLWVNSTRPTGQFYTMVDKLLEAKDCAVRAAVTEYERPFTPKE